jgi:PhnO protein
MTMRPASPWDAPRISELLGQLGWNTTSDQVVDGLDVSSTEVTVAESDDQVVGVIAITTRHQFHRGAMVTTIDTLIVDERHRSRGIGELLVDVAVDSATGNDAQAIEVASHLRRVDARRFYERLGFQVDANYFVRAI